MHFRDYQIKSREYACYPENDTGGNIIYNTIALCGEVGEIANNLKKKMRIGEETITEEFRLHMLDELGDVLWYLAQLSYDLGIDFEEIAYFNIEKLDHRVKTGTLKSR